LHVTIQPRLEFRLGMDLEHPPVRALCWAKGETVNTDDVRPIRKDELEDLLPLVAGYQRFYEAEPSLERNRIFFAQFIDPSDKGLLLGAWVNGELVGFATLYWFYSSAKAAPSALMNDLYVREDARGAGAGKRLIDGAVAEARRRKAAHLEWYTSPDNEVAQRLYDSYEGAIRTTWLAYEIDLGKPRRE
jgi:GNAT superfamily N-acetyltransferase